MYNFYLTLFLEVNLTGIFAGSTKLADASIQKYGTRWPVVVLEVAVSESTNKLYRDAEKWLKGTQIILSL